MVSIFKLGIKSRVSFLLLIPLLFGIYFLPDFILFLVFGMVVLTVLHTAFQLKWAMKTYKKPNFRTLIHFPKISIHIPTHNEPAEVVIRTIKSCLSLDYPNYEIIIMDNNTTDRRLWEPVQRFCEQHSRIKFCHVEKLSGYKAGALNKCMELTDPLAKYVFVVDADYMLSPDSLHRAVGIAQGEKAMLVQFPQSYVYEESLAGMNEEYNHYFKAFARGSNRSKSMLSTGTLSLYCIDALKNVGGWKTSSITEDAEIAIKFHEKNFKSVYADILIGQGLLPSTLTDMRVQRERWAFGNMQCLLNLAFQKKVPFIKKCDIAIQLTAWINFLGFSLLTLLGLLIIFPFYEIRLFYPIIYMIGLNIGCYMAGKFFLFGITTKFYSQLHFQAFFTHMSMLDVHTFSWWDSLIGLKKPFQRTNKFFKDNSESVLPIGLALLMAMAGVILIIKGYLPLGYTFIVFASINYMGINLLAHQLFRTTGFYSKLNTAKP
jgi:cellulose synthase/poly-beta-1,6-N-acetylglucosamine synthase-like glycosyltransferase